MTDKQADQKAIRLLRKVDAMRAELRRLEHDLAIEAVAYGKRRGYFFGYREFHMRQSIDCDTRQKGEAA